MYPTAINITTKIRPKSDLFLIEENYILLWKLLQKYYHHKRGPNEQQTFYHFAKCMLHVLVLQENTKISLLKTAEVLWSDIDFPVWCKEARQVNASFTHEFPSPIVCATDCQCFGVVSVEMGHGRLYVVPKNITMNTMKLCMTLLWISMTFTTDSTSQGIGEVSLSLNLNFIWDHSSSMEFRSGEFAGHWRMFTCLHANHFMTSVLWHGAVLH